MRNRNDTNQSLESMEAGKTSKNGEKGEKEPKAKFFPRIWLIVWFGINISLTLMNKKFFRDWRFPFPVTLSSIHMASTWIFTSILPFQRKTLSLREQGTIFLFSLIFTLNIAVGNTSIHYLTVSLNQVVRSIIPGITMMLSYFFLGTKYNKYHISTIGLVVIGVAMATMGEHSTEFNPLGFTLTLIVCCLSSCKSVLTQKFIKQFSFHPMDILNRLSGWAFINMTIAAFLLGEHSRLLKDWAPEASMLEYGILALNGFLAFLLNYSNFMASQTTSAVVITIAGNIKHLTTIAISIVLFGTKVTLLNTLGTIITVIGAACYSLVKFVVKKQ